MSGFIMLSGSTISCADPRSDASTDQLDWEEIDSEPYERRPAGSDIYNGAVNVTPYPAVIGVFIVWLKARMESPGPETCHDGRLS